MTWVCPGANDTIPPFVPSGLTRRPNVIETTSMTRKVAILVFDGFQILDAAGPLAAFESANALVPKSYELTVCAAQSGLITSSSGCSLVGPIATFAAHTEYTARRWRGWYGARNRLPSNATVAFQSTWHGFTGRECVQWNVRLGDRRNSRRQTRNHPLVPVPRLRNSVPCNQTPSPTASTSTTATCGPRLGSQPASISCWLSSRSTWGADRPSGRATVGRYYRRPGGQSQFSPLLSEQAGGRFEGLLDYIRTHLTSDLSVSGLAKHMGMSPRHFSRTFMREVGLGPAQAVQRIRAETARVMLEAPKASVKQTAILCGFGNPEHLRRTLHRHESHAP